MSRRLLLLAVLSTVFLWGTGALAAIDPGHDYVPGEVIIKFKATASSADKASVLSELNSTPLKTFKMKAEHHRLNGMSVEEAIRRFDGDPRVEYIEPNYLVYAVEVPNDPRFPDLWGMNNTGQTGGTPDADIDAPEAWDVFTGSQDVLVCVIDTGVDYTHPDLAANMWVNPNETAGNGIDDDGNGYIDDTRGWDFYNNDNDSMDDNDHGSHCSGTIGGVGNNGVGVAGVNWNVKIVGVKFLSSGGSGSTEGAISSVEYATGLGVDIMSNSWGGGGFSQALMDAIEAANAADIFFAAAAGNAGNNNDVSPFYPATYTNANIISVMATDHNDNRVNEPGWWASNYGATTVDIAAPGLHIWSTTPGNTYQDFSGTSMATPHISGALAMLRGRFPGISVAAGKNLLLTLGNEPKPQLAGLCVSGGRLNLLFLIADPDETPPSAVTDLATTDAASNWIDLQWSAPGDDDIVGTCSSYDMRYSTSPIDDTNWDTASQATGEPDPQAYGMLETMRVNGLTFDTPYYFAVKGRDEYGNVGALSNIASGTTLGAPTISVVPASLTATLPTGGTAQQTVTVSNVGEGVLDFTVPGAEFFLPGKRALPPQATYMEVAKGAADYSTSGPQVLGSGGPDAFGYRWKDSDEAGGPAFNWVEIDQIGTSMTMSDDTNQGPFPIGFTFGYYGNDYTDFRVCSNGWISFSSTSTSYSNGGLPSTSAPFDMLAIFWDDLNPTTGSVFYYSDGSRLIVEWKNVPLYSGGGSLSFQVHVYADGKIQYHYQTLAAAVNSCSVGMQNADGTDGLLVVNSAAYLHDNMAIQFAALPEWLTASPTSGSLGVGESQDITVTFNAEGLCGSQFLANLHILSNDPITPDAVVPATLNLIAETDIAVEPALLDFGQVYVTATADLPVMVTNIGCADLNVTQIEVTGDFSADTTPFSVLAGASQALTVTFAPTVAGTRTGTLTLTSNDPDTPVVTVDLTGVGLDFPNIAVDPTSLTETLPTGGTSTQLLTISNTGAGELNFTIPEAEYINVVKRSAAPIDSKPIELGKDDVDPRPGINGAGGPDVFGYTWKDSDEVGGPAFNWIEIQGVGTQITLTDDSNAGPFAIGFPFDFYGTEFTSFRVCSNGFVSFTSTSTSLTNYALPSVSAPENLLALFHDDLNPGIGGSVWYLYDGTRLIVEWKDVPHYSTGGPYSMQIHLYPSGRIEYHYLSMVSRLNEATIGIQNAARDDGLTVAFNANYVHDNMAVRFAAAPEWLTRDPSSGSIPAGGTAEITVGFNAAELCGDQFLANLHILSNDPDTPDLAVPVTLNLIAESDIEVAPLALDFGPVYVSASADLDVTVTNAGCASLSVSQIAIDNGDFTTDTTPFDLAAGESRVLTVTFSPSVAGTINGILTLTSDDLDEPTVDVSLTGVGLDTPLIAVDPTSITQAVPVDGQRSRTLTINNNGAGVLNFTVLTPIMYNKALPEATKAATDLPTSDLPKGAVDPRPGMPQVNGSGGPDTFGYRWIDSDEAGGPVYNWIEISTIGTPIPFTGDDQNFGPYPIGFSFPFYGAAFTDFRACSNGWISFTSTATTYTNYQLPSASAPENLVAAFYDDHTFSTSGDAFYYNDGQRLIVEYQNVPHLSTGGPYTFQIHLYPSGRIEFHYQSMVARLNEATIGIQNAARNDGLTVVYNANYVHDNLAIRFSQLEWLSVDTTTGSVPPGGSYDVTVNFDATGVDLGLHDGLLRITSNDPQNPSVDVPVTMNVSDLTGVDDIPQALPTVTALHQNVPNPFNPATTIKFDLPVRAATQLRIYDVRGSLVRTLINTEMPAGAHSVLWDGHSDAGRQVASGVYFYKLSAGDFQSIRRMMLVK